MANYLNKPLAADIQNNYVSQYVPLPLEQFARAQAKQEATQNMYEGAVTQQQDANWKLSGVADEDNNYIKGLRDSFDEVAGQLVNRDLTQKVNQDAAKDLVKGVSRDNTLGTILANKSRYDEWQKNKAEMVKNNTYQPFNDAGQATYEDYVRSGGYKSGKSITPDIFKYEDSEPVRKQFFDDLQKLGSESIARIGDQWYKNGVDGISEARIGTQANAAIKSYMATTAAAQDGREYDYMVRNADPKTLTKDGSLKDANGKPFNRDKYILDKFLTTGLERAGLSYTTGRAAAMTANAKDKKEETSNLWENVVNTETPGTLSNGREIKFTKDGQIDGSGLGIVDSFKKNGFTMKTISDWWNDDRANEEESKDYKHIITGAKLNNVTPEEYSKVYNTTSHMVVRKPLIGKDLRDNNEVLFNGGAGIWSTLNVMNTTTGEKNMNFVDAINKIADKNGWDMPDPTKNPAEFSKFMKDNGVSIIGQAEPNEFSTKPVIFTVGGDKIAADMTFGGTIKPYKTTKENQDAETKANYDKLQKGQQILEKDSKGNDVIYFKDIKTGEIKHKLVKDLK